MRKKFYLVFTVSLAGVMMAACTQDPSNRQKSLSATPDSMQVSSKKGSDTTAMDKPTVHSDFLLVPGQSAGHTHLNEDLAQVVNRLGKPDGGDAAMGKAVSVWYALHDTSGYSTAIYSSRNMGNDDIARVKEIRVTSPAFLTAEGIHVTSPLSMIRKHYGVKMTETYRDQNVRYKVFDSDRGIAFEIGPDSICKAIVIHQPGVVGEGTYLKFRTTNKSWHTDK